ncbi:hypothetical protein GF361_05035 [Candidatus Woesearchaeota archaeon]|nr:hypothetical protein [Candidatus Woesearchaeota archaeon]
MAKKETQLGLNGKKAKKPKEITIRLNTSHLKTAVYILVILILVFIIIAQQIGWVPTKNYIGTGTSYLNDYTQEDKISNAKKTPGVTIIKPNGSETSGSSNKSSVDNQTASENNNTEQKKDELLPITGEIIFTINKINIDPKENIEDYSKITSVTFTIKNQDEDLDDLQILGYLTMYGEDDEKTVDLDSIEAGHQITKTESGLVFGYNNVDEEHILNLELYDNKKLVKKVSKKFN